jgi:hypothetical protein
MIIVNYRYKKNMLSIYFSVYKSEGYGNLKV